MRVDRVSRYAVAIVALCVAIGPCAAAAIAQEEGDPQRQRALRREPARVGPRTEPVEGSMYAAVLHVAPSGSARGDGSREAPLATISQAIATATDAAEGKRYAVFVAAGDYLGETIRMKSYVDVYGGFDASAWERNIDAHRSILDGEKARRIVVGANHSRIDGFTMRNGVVRDHGGAILCDHASPTISNNTIINNATLEPEGFAERRMIHQRGHEGGGIACINGASPLIENNVIAKNTTEVGGGAGIAALNNSLPRVENNVITENQTGLVDITRSRSSNGGGISASHAPTRPPLRMTIVNNVIANNRIGGNSDGGGIYLEYDSTPLVVANWIVGNLCQDDGGGMYVMTSSHPDIVGNVFSGNRGHGAIVLSKGGRANIEENVIHANAGGVTCHDSWMTLRNNTIVDNRGAGVRHSGSDPGLKGAIVQRNIIYGNAGAAQIDEGTAEAMVVTGNAIAAGYRGRTNVDVPPSFGNDRILGQATSVEYDPRRGLTRIVTRDVSPSERLSGRAINIGQRWGVIKTMDHTAGRIVVWGDLRTVDPAETRFEIAHTYTLRSALGAGASGK